MASEYDLLRAVVGEEAEKMVGAHSEVFIVSKSSSVPFPASPPINMSGTSLGDVTPEQMSSTSGGSDSDDEVPRMYALKRQLIRNPEDGDERTYKELRIFIELKRCVEERSLTCGGVSATCGAAEHDSDTHAHRTY